MELAERMPKLLAFLIAALMVDATWAINKCTGPNNNLIYQDAPCPGKGEKIEAHPASGYAPTTNSAPQSTPPVAKKEGAFGPSWQRMTFLQNRGVPDAHAALQKHQKNCDAQHEVLAARKSQTNNNLAGATLQNSIATEMQALAISCESKAKDLRIQSESLEKELRELSTVR